MLAERPGLEVVLSLAGRTAQPLPQPVPTRSGGFGGAAGLAEHLRQREVDVLVDATHPFADRMSANAAAAAKAAGVKLVVLRRPAWTRQPSDRWIEVADTGAAVAALGARPRRVLLAIGRQEAAAFEAAPQHAYLVRSVDPVDPPLAVPDARYLLGRGPFGEAEEQALLEAHHIDAVVAKNSGGEATYGKVAAARRLAIEVVMIARPQAAGAAVTTVEQAAEAVAQALASRTDRGV